MRLFTTKSPSSFVLPAPAALIALAFVGAMSALAGGYWDDAWHTERGRDEFFIAPHIAIYAGITLAGLALTAWAALAARSSGAKAIWGHQPLRLALLSVAVTLASGPIDNVWHVAFGRDSVIWSPPHMLGIAGTLALGAALLTELARRPQRWAARATVVAGALVLAAATFSVAEYETDVPQFDELWYLPVLSFAAAIALVLVRVASTRPWAATGAAAVYTLFMLGVSGFLALAGFPAPALVLLLAPAVVVDLAARRSWPAPLAALAYVAVLYAAYVPVRNGLGDGVRLDRVDVLAGLLLAWITSTAVFAVAGGRRLLRASARPATAAAAAALAALLAAPGALAHDPGQGDPAGTADVTVQSVGDRISLTAELPRGTCDQTEPRALVARRAGTSVRAPLQRRSCTVEGSLPLPAQGRWFVYAELARDGRPIETWLPISVGSTPARVADPARYAYFPKETSGSAIKAVGGVLLYAGMLALLWATFVLIGPSRRAGLDAASA